MSGSFETADGQSGTFENPVAIEGGQLCVGEGAAKECHLIYPYEGGFLEVNTDGSLHAVSVPL